ncbi:hypothetical protein BKA62DRAFT_700465 [Auriculariales sp. MPI-PUGE-AT-0066]|nr:hypothetical protein BKA62DRAFT_700465 [Auriculariales sp. MPI-PUGE-AT-0066]
MSTSPKVAPFVYLNGPPGVGKQTVEARLVDNHLLIDLRKDMLDGIARSENLSSLFVFTGSNNSKNPVSLRIIDDFLAAAAERKAPFIFILLECELEEHMGRATAVGRQPGPGKQGKWVNAEGLRKTALGGGWVDLEGKEGVHGLKLDTTGKTPVESAQMIVDIVQGITSA